MEVVCNSYILMMVLLIIKTIMSIISILVPILLIFFLSLDFFNGTVSFSDMDKELKTRFFIRVGAAIFIFALPFIVSLFMALLEEVNGKTVAFECYKNASIDNLKKVKKLEEDEKSESKNLSKIEKERKDNERNSVLSERERLAKENAAKAEKERKAEEERIKKKQEVERKEREASRLSDNTKLSSKSKTMYVGDSRTVGIYGAYYGYPGNSVSIAQGNDYYFAKVSMGLTWFKSAAIPKIKEVAKDGDYNVFINLGTNDIHNGEAYATEYNKLATEMPEINFIIISVTPVEETGSKYPLKNKEVASFNNKLRLNLSKKSNLKYCDVYTMLGSNYKTVDGIHYDNDSNKRIFEFYKKC